MSIKGLKFLLLGLVIIATRAAYGQQPDKGFRASVVKVARQSTGINDRIYHRIVAMDDGVKQFFLVSTDICVMSPSEYDHVAAILQKDLGIDPENFWWTLTHTHSAPEVGVPGLPEVFMGDRYKHDVDTAYTSLVERSLIKGITEARNKLAKAKLGAGVFHRQILIGGR
jgi:hypothetical protein